MKKNWKSLGSILLIVVLSIALVACGGGKSGTQTTEDGKIIIEYWHGNADTQGGRSVTELVEKYNASQDQYQVEAVYHDGLYVGLMENLQTSVAGGEYPALVQIGWAYREYFQANFEFTDPESLISAVGSDEDANYLTEKFPVEMLNLATDYEGDLLGLPYSVSTPVIYVNKEIADAAGVDPTTITTYEELYAMSREINQSTGKYGLYITLSNDNWSTQGLIESNGAVTVDESGQAAFASPQGQKALQDWADGIADGHILHVDTATGHQSFITGDVGMCWTTIAQRDNITSNAGFEAYAIELPGYAGNQPAVPAGGALLAVTAQEDDQKAAAWDFLKFLYQPENIAIWTEGTGYLPPTTDATQDQDLKTLIETDQMFQTSYNQMENLVPFSSFPGNNGLQASDIYRDMRDRVFAGTPASEEMPKVEDEINEMIQ